MSQKRHSASVIDQFGNSQGFAPSLCRGDNPTRLFAEASSRQVPIGGISICFSEAVTLDAIDRAELLLKQAKSRLLQIVTSA
jgi:hypothetical protein